MMRAHGLTSDSLDERELLERRSVQHDAASIEIDETQERPRLFRSGSAVTVIA